MRKLIFLIICFILSTYPLAYAKEGECGYEGGISSGQNLSTTQSSLQYEYQEVVFITGKPIVMKGKVDIKKKTSNDTETITYQYDISDLNNNSLKRSLTLTTKITNKDNQIIKDTSIYKKPTETIVIDDTTYTLDTYYLTKSSITDVRPAVGYFAGNISSKKVYKSQGDAPQTITVNTEGETFGYDQKWSSAETQILNNFIQFESATDNWSGTAKVKLSSTMTKSLKYSENALQEISFEGGYIQSENTISKLRYETQMPQFDKDGIATDRILKKSGNLKIEAFPKDKRLIINDLSSVRGHWAETDIKKLYSLEIYDEPIAVFIPNQYISRAEFAKALAKSIGDVPAVTSNKKTTIKSPYQDLDTSSPYFPYIFYLTERNVLSGYDDGNFYPYEPISRVQAIEAFIKVLGLEVVSKDQFPITIFKDNDEIPTWSLRSVKAAYQIGFIQGNNGYLYPNQYLTKAETATLINRFIEYMSQSLAKSYSDKVLNY